MNIFLLLYNELIYRPLFNGLAFFVGVVPYHDIGIAIIILTIVVRIALLPLSHRATKTQMKIKEIEPHIRKIKEKFKKNKEEQAKQMMALYRQHRINPFSGFVIILIQLPILFALYKLFWNGVRFDVDNLYFFITLPEVIQSKFLGIFDVSQSSVFLAVLAGVSQFFHTKLISPSPKKKSSDNSFQDSFTQAIHIQMKYIMPLFIFFIALQFTSAIALYLTTMNIFAIVHTGIVKKYDQRHKATSPDHQGAH